MMNEWKIGISSVQYANNSSPLLLHGTIEENLQKAAALGYDAIEIHMRENEILNYDHIRQAMRETGVSISMIVTGKLATEGFCTLTDDRPYVEKAALKGVMDYIDIASKLGAGIVLGWVRGTIPANQNFTPYMRRLGKNLQEINNYSKVHHVPVVIEVINHYEMNIFTKAEQLLSFISEWELDNCFVHLDTYHMNLEEDNLSETILQVGDKLGYLHLADNQRWYPGSGNIDFISVFHALRAIHYTGYVTVECFPRDDRDDTAKKAIESIRDLIKQSS
ncbi:sugar phosphate isomerase/epimerase family protein [Bilifractor porci]|jgi:sugar phosphate isomerase/epimerase|uniref:Sugar phosphate isomerase/epimerase n=1 Tax=Bilifractor porci TaxID=2606636 RepID=A0A7X2P8N5_9FIRM|nr:sugar phosphate isomerase/epimerase family protein [Bilifractor porci]MST82216.1 sugar phosphate isomerase/epimerase [Bilifractor porci]